MGEGAGMIRPRSERSPGLLELNIYDHIPGPHTRNSQLLFGLRESTATLDTNMQELQVEPQQQQH